LELPAALTSIGRYAFYNCDGLDSLVIPAKVSKIDDYAFRACSNLKKIISKAAVPPVTDSPGLADTTLIMVPCGKASVYKAAAGWSGFSNIQDSSIYVLTIASTEGGTVNIDTAYSCGTRPTISAKAGNGFVFCKWSDGSEANPYTIDMVSDTTLQPIWSRLFNLTLIDGDDTTRMTGSNGRLTLPTPVKTDYTFMGWYLAGDTVAFSPDFVLSQDTTFFARWKTATMAQEYKADEIAIYASDRLIHIIGTSSDAAIYAANGQAIYRGKKREIAVKPGIYLVVVAGKRATIIVCQ
jgi:uncharacterized repeat protein (TIGR02543 family)